MCAFFFEKTSMTDSRPLLARQSILDRQEKLIGYELLFRDEKGKAQFDNALQATTTVLQEWMLRDITSTQELTFINTDEEIIQLEVLDQLRPDGIVLEILEDTPYTPSTFERYASLKQRGYTLALDDFDFSEDHFNKLNAFSPLVDIVKIEIPALQNDFSPLIHLRQNWKGKLLAEKVEDQPTYALCRRAGADYFQGYYFARPEIISGQKYDSSTEETAFVLSQIQVAEDMDAIEALFKPRGALVVGILAYINSAAMSRGNQIQSLRQALGLLGRKNITQWLTMMIASGHKGQAAAALIDHAIVHASLNEALAKELHPKWQRSALDQSYLAGLFSQLPALLQTDPMSLYQKLNLSQELIDALCKSTGDQGKLLSWTRSLLDPSRHWDTELPCSRSRLNEFIEQAWLQSESIRQSI